MSVIERNYISINLGHGLRGKDREGGESMKAAAWASRVRGREVGARTVEVDGVGMIRLYVEADEVASLVSSWTARPELPGQISSTLFSEVGGDANEGSEGSVPLAPVEEIERPSDDEDEDIQITVEKRYEAAGLAPPARGEFDLEKWMKEEAAEASDEEGEPDVRAEAFMEPKVMMRPIVSPSHAARALSRASSAGSASEFAAKVTRGRTDDQIKALLADNRDSREQVAKMARDHSKVLERVEQLAAAVEAMAEKQEASDAIIAGLYNDIKRLKEIPRPGVVIPTATAPPAAAARRLPPTPAQTVTLTPVQEEVDWTE